MTLHFIRICALLLLTTCCGIRPNICSDNIESLWIERYDDNSIPIRVEIDKADCPIILDEVNRCRQGVGKYYPKAFLLIKYQDGQTSRMGLLSENCRLLIGPGDTPFISNKPHPVLKRYLSVLEKKKL